jgi:3-oxoacyl-[acyl-carrier protein] reductase
MERNIPMRLPERRALVTGGSRGIGRAIVERFLAEGACVAFTHVRADGDAEDVVTAARKQGQECHAIRADAGDAQAQAAAVAQAVYRFGGLDILVHNAGTAKVPPDLADGIGEYRRQMAVNAEGIFAATDAALPFLTDGGRIIVIGSVGSHFMPFPGGAIYGATKAAATALARGWARDLGPRAITVNVVQPGPVDTDLNPADGPYSKMLCERVALGRYGRPAEIASVVAFLAGEEAGFITGAVIDVDGGFSI